MTGEVGFRKLRQSVADAKGRWNCQKRQEDASIE
jgi:hypothetical protein